MGRKCSIEGCNELISDRSRLDVCPNCRSSDYRWDKRSPAEAMNYRVQLTIRSARMDRIVPAPKLEKFLHKPARKKFANGKSQSLRT